MPPFKTLPMVSQLSSSCVPHSPICSWNQFEWISLDNHRRPPLQTENVTSAHRRQSASSANSQLNRYWEQQPSSDGKCQTPQTPSESPAPSVRHLLWLFAANLCGFASSAQQPIPIGNRKASTSSQVCKLHGANSPPGSSDHQLTFNKQSRDSFNLLSGGLILCLS